MILLKMIEETCKMMMTKIGLAVIVSSVATYVAYDKYSQELALETEDNISVAETRPQNVKRSPSSIKHKKVPGNSVGNKPSAKISSYDQSNFVEPKTKPGGQNASPSDSRGYSSSNNTSPFTSPMPELVRQNTKEEKNSSVLANVKKPEKASELESVFRGSFTQLSLPKKEIKEDISNENIFSSSKYTSPAVISNACSTNIVGGSFGNPIGITLECIFPSTIKYCLSTDVCCDPESNGTTYSSQVVIGPKNGTYCLSYIGDSPTGGSSVVYQQNYTINSTFPDLNVGHSKIFYQTTELNGTSFISSQDFGKANFSVGQINLKSHDPGPDGLNYDCEEIIANYVDLPAPGAVEVLSLFDVSIANINSQVEIPLRLEELEYGDNFITSYIENNSYVAPLYSCSTTKVNLEDFEYFQADASQSETGNNSIREFEGEFSSFGFFEDLTVIRGPAGLNSEEKSGENLKSGLYGLMY